MTAWHAPPEALAQFARTPELVDEVMASSIEQHLVACADCRAAVAGAADPTILTRTWNEVLDVIDQPHLTHAERVLDRLGMPTHYARLVGATPSLRLAWLATTVLLAAAAALVARDTGSDTPYLIIAPLVPLGSVLLAFLPTEQPGGEAGVATPMNGLPLLLHRVVAVLVPTFAILVIAGFAQPDPTAGGFRWVLPGLALALGSLALSTVMRATTAAAALAMAWVMLVLLVSALDGRSIAVADSVTFSIIGQASAAALAVTASAWLYVRRDAFSTLEVTW